MTLRQNINRALTTPCTADILGHFKKISRPDFRVGTHRPTFSRLNDILLELRGGKTCNNSSLAKRFKVSTKSVQRDLDFLRAEGFAISWNGRANTYRLEAASQHPWLNHGAFQQLKGVR